MKEGLFEKGHTAVVVDLKPVMGVTFAAATSRCAHVVLVLPRWPHPDAVLPCEPLTQILVQQSKHLRTYEGNNVVFVLDGERNNSIRRSTTDRRVDNRYELSPGDLPNLQTLRAAGIQRIVKVSRP